MSETGRSPQELTSLERLLGLAVFGEKVAARTYSRMADLESGLASDLRSFAAMEGRHSGWFLEAARQNDVTPDQAFADGELGYLIEQVEGYRTDFEALAVLQGFIVECLAVATYQPFLKIAPRYPGTAEALSRALAEERVHMEWIARYFRERYAGDLEAFLALTQRVNTQGVDCVGGTLMNIANSLKTLGVSGSDCAANMLDEYAVLLEQVGLDSTDATRCAVSHFVPLVRKHRRPS